MFLKAWVNKALDVILGPEPTPGSDPFGDDSQDNNHAQGNENPNGHSEDETPDQPPPKPETEWSDAVRFIRQHDWTRTIEALIELDPSVQQDIMNPTNGNNEHDRLQFVVNKKYYANVSDHNHQNAARYAVLYAHMGLDIAEASRFLQNSSSHSLEKQFTKDMKLVRATIDSDSGVLVSEPMNIVGGIARIFESVAKMMSAHAYADQAFSESCTLGLLRNVQPMVEQIGTEYIALFVNKWKLDILTQEIKLDRFAIGEPNELADPLEELVLICQHCELYKMYIRRHYEKGIDALKERGFQFFNEPGVPDSLPNKQLNIFNYVKEPDALYKSQQELLAYYLVVEKFYVGASIEKALRVTEAPPADDEISVSPAIDYAFVTLQRVAERGCITKDADTASQIITFLASFCAVQLRDSLVNRVRESIPQKKSIVSTRLMNTISSKLQTPELLSTPVKVDHRKQGLYLNDIYGCHIYITKFCQDLQKKRNFFFKRQEEAIAKTDTALKGFEETSKQLLSACSTGSLLVLETHAVELNKRLGVFTTLDYELDNARFKEFELNDPWVAPFIIYVKEIFAKYKPLLTTGAYDEFIHALIGLLCKEIESIALHKKFNYFGGLQFAGDIRQLYNYFTSASTKTVRNKFSRLNQMTQLLSVEKLVEVSEYWSAGDEDSKTWTLSATDARAVLKCRVEFSLAAVDRLKL